MKANGLNTLIFPATIAWHHTVLCDCSEFGILLYSISVAISRVENGHELKNGNEFNNSLVTFLLLATLNARHQLS